MLAKMIAVAAACVITTLTAAEVAELASTSVSASSDDAKIVEQLRALRPLPKIHYSWALPAELLDPGDRRLFELVRITHAASLRGEWSTSRQVEAAVIACKAVNATGPTILATLAINYSPWAPGRRGKGVSPKDDEERLRRLHAREVVEFRQKLLRFKRWLSDANRRHRTDIRVSALLLDCEQFTTRESDPAWNSALTERYNRVYDIGQAIFPNARIEWFGRGIRRVAYGDGWDTHRHFTFCEKADAFSCSLYRVPEIGYTRETFRRTYELAQAHGAEEVTPYVALAAGWRRRADKFHAWDFDWDYDLIYSWQLGRELNHPWFGERATRFAPWDAAKVVVFYPPPFDPRTPAWSKHFVAYVGGANGIQELP